MIYNSVRGFDIAVTFQFFGVLMLANAQFTHKTCFHHLFLKKVNALKKSDFNFDNNCALKHCRPKMDIQLNKCCQNVSIFFFTPPFQIFFCSWQNFWNNYIFYLFLGILGPLCSQGPPRFSYLSSSSGPKKTPLQRPTTQSNNLNFF